jgi:predicted phosphodiesterase
MDTTNVLIIGDTHEPACLDEYLDFCKDLKKKYKITHTVHIGDEMDVHAANYHEHDPDGLSAGDELELTIKRLARWHKAFPGMDVVIGNHTRMFARKAFSAGIPARVLRGLKEVLEVPTWNYANRFKYDGVLYIHGEGVTARTKAMRSGCSVVQGHRHSESYVHYNENRTFGMQVGCGVDADHYAMVYAKDGPAQILSAGLVLNNGTLPIVIPMI